MTQISYYDMYLPSNLYLTRNPLGYPTLVYTYNLGVQLNLYNQMQMNYLSSANFDNTSGTQTSITKITEETSEFTPKK